MTVSICYTSAVLLAFTSDTAIIWIAQSVRTLTVITLASWFSYASYTEVCLAAATITLTVITSAINLPRAILAYVVRIAAEVSARARIADITACLSGSAARWRRLDTYLSFAA